jgi:hypothetical protein
MLRLEQRAGADRVFIDIEDECGGLGVDEVEDLFRPYSQCSSIAPVLVSGCPFAGGASERAA